jgi:opacity protein-like surface antigen
MKSSPRLNLFTAFLAVCLFGGVYSQAFAGPYYYDNGAQQQTYDPGSPNGHGYIGAIAAVTNNQRTDVALESIDGPTVRFNLDQEPGWLAGMKAGWLFPDSGLFKYAFEGEILYNAGKLNGDSTIDGEAIAVEADMTAWVFMASAMVRLDLGAFEPYVGFGLGGVHLSVEDPKITINGDTETGNNLGDWGWAYQLVAGGEFMLFADRLGIFGEYKYLSYQAVEQIEDYREHVFGAGVRVHF